MAKKKSNTGMIIAIIVSVIVVGIVVWGFLTKWKFIGDGKSTENAKTKAKNQLEAIMNTPTDTKVVEVTPKIEEKLKKIQQKDEEKIKSMSEGEIQQKLLKVQKDTEEQVSGFRIIEHMSPEETSDGSSLNFSEFECKFTDEEIELVITKALNIFKRFFNPNLDVTSAIPKMKNYYKVICSAQSLNLKPDLIGLCRTMLGYEFNPHTIGLYDGLDFLKPPKPGPAGILYKYRYMDFGEGPLFSTADKQNVEWSDEPESKEIRILYILYKALKECPVVQAPPPPPGCDDTSYKATDSFGDGCPEYAKVPTWCGTFDSDTFKSSNCCACK